MLKPEVANNMTEQKSLALSLLCAAGKGDQASWLDC